MCGLGLAEDGNRRNQGGEGWRESVLGEMTRIGGPCGNLDSGNSLESTRVTLERTPTNGDMEPDPAIFYSQERLPAA